MRTHTDPYLPMSSVHLMVPPLRLMSACMWQVVQERNVDQYGKLVEFITLVAEMVPELMNYKQRAQLILGLRARMILEVLRKVDPVDSDAIQEQISLFQKSSIMCKGEEDQDGEVETSRSAFVELVETLLSDKNEKDTFLKEVFPELYGTRYDTVLQILVWEFFLRLEELFPVPSFLKISTMVDLTSFDFQFEEFVPDRDDLKKILHHQKYRQKLTQSEYSFMSETILSTLASRHTSVASEDHVDHDRDGNVGNSSDEETDNSSVEPTPSSPQREESRLLPLTSSSFYEEGGVAGETGVYETQVTLSDEILDEPAADGTTVQESRSTGVLKPNLRSGTAENLTCPGCGKSFRKPMMLRHHQKSEHPTTEQVYQCDKCDKTFQTKRRLEQHHQAHATVKPYTCSYCGKGLPCPKVLKTHMRVHTGERRYGCKICGKKFDQASTLTHHMRLHKGDKPFLCSECGKAFPSSSAFLIHTRMHTGERPYQCKECGKRYVTLHRLKVHQGLHTLERPYTCDQCGKSFRYPSEFGRHKVIHAGEKTFKCVICDKRFSLAGNLKSHMQIHAKTRAAKKSSQ
ncbi:zinc finger protein 485-like isoform X2 [Sparus aurata]|uniref:zinc finger protein 485-like isoform X2 n=1 Tax=Sparus aurata TaxID=8175 RepID=UPI0011C12D7F|nr:zinc finger protein 485-like isoform X2 [Sparus aurata]XP_030295819.1 zinc finger protein 485-like isoform X2 [Sparus aurata]XP_030295820.1 zinc finger protein 485-like isoform X2 [Sparus aurata]